MLLVEKYVFSIYLAVYVKVQKSFNTDLHI